MEQLTTWRIAAERVPIIRKLKNSSCHDSITYKEWCENVIDNLDRTVNYRGYKGIIKANKKHPNEIAVFVYKK